MCSWHSKVDPAIRRHGEPHVVRVGIVMGRTSRPRVEVNVLHIFSGAYLSEYFEVVFRSLGVASISDSDVHKHLPGSGGDHTGDGEGEGTSVLEIG